MIGTAVVMETPDYILYPSISICSVKYNDLMYYEQPTLKIEGQEPAIFAQKSPNVKDAILQLRFTDINGTERITDIDNEQKREDVQNFAILQTCSPYFLCLCYITAQ